MAETGGDPLPSWSDGPVRRAIFRFIDRVAREGSPDFVPTAEHVAAVARGWTVVSMKQDWKRIFYDRAE